MKLDCELTSDEPRVYVSRSTDNYGCRWSEERTELLKKLWADGLSASQIASRIGGLSRNAVIGKVHRLELQGRRTVVRMRSRTRSAAKAEKLQRVLNGEGHYKKTMPRMVSEPLPPEPPRPAKLTSFEDLQDDQCRFIYGDPKTADSGFCGCKKVPGLPYCAGHAHGENGCFRPEDPRHGRKLYVGSGWNPIKHLTSLRFEEAAE